jgi:hypothetical protein
MMTTETSRDLRSAVLDEFTPVCPSCGLRYPDCANMNPTQYLPDAVAVEDEIARRGLQEPYVRALVGNAEEAVARLWYCGVDDLWRVATATPEQRCRAALAAVGEG